MKISLLGTGWLGSALFAALLKNDRYTLLASYRSPDTHKKLRKLINTSFGYQSSNPKELTAISEANLTEALQADAPEHQLIRINVPNFTDPDIPFFSADTLIVTLPPGRRRENVLELYPAEINSIIERAEANGIKHIIYTSSTGVYGNTKELVTETTIPQPTTDSAKAVLVAETIMQASTIPSTILRLAGLYGPGRHPGRWFAGKESLPNSESPVNLVHQQDVVDAIKKVIASGPPVNGHDIYNVCAATHPSKAEFYGKAIENYGGSLPKMLPGGGDGKRIDSGKIRREMDWRPANDLLSFPLT